MLKLLPILLACRHARARRRTRWKFSARPRRLTNPRKAGRRRGSTSWKKCGAANSAPPRATSTPGGRGRRCASISPMAACASPTAAPNGTAPRKASSHTKKPAPWDSRGRRAFHEFYYNYEGIADFVKSADFITPPGKDGFLIEVTYELPGRVAGEVTKNYWIDAQHYTVRRETSNPVAIVEPPTAGPVKLTRTITFEKVDLNAPVDAVAFHRSRPMSLQPSGPAPDFALTDLDGAPVSLKDLRRQGGAALLLGVLVRHLPRGNAEAGADGRSLSRPRPGPARHQRRRSGDRLRVPEGERPHPSLAGGPLEGRVLRVTGSTRFPP